MKILITSIGTRGDMEPFLAIGEMLKNKRHEVMYLFPEQFRTLAEESNTEFASLGNEFMEMLESDTGKFALGGGGSTGKKIFAYIKLAKIQSRNNRLMVERQFKTVSEYKPDRIVHHGKVMYPVIWEINNPGKTVFVSPVPYLHYVKRHTHLAFHSNYGEFFNKLTYKLADWGLKKAIMMAVKWLQATGITKRQVKNALKNHKTIYAVSPQLFERPGYWKENLQVLGFHERDKTTNWQPDNELIQFLEKHSKIILVTFGSMTNPEPEKKTGIILNILKRNNIPAIINTCSGGLTEPEAYDRDLFHFVQGIPYDWIFPKVYGVIHHGGSGTTHMAIKNGCVSLIIPHIIDQFVWDRIAYEKGIGPRGIKISKMTEKNLEPKILELINNSSFKEKARQLGEKMRSENFIEELYNQIIK
ncbi:MAG: nucleotide disphospho-sugar-binding domain-containing protein [Ferruginibacter sp.]